MNLSLQLPFSFLNNVSVTSFTSVCDRCGRTLTPEMIDAEITEWGKHIIVIRGTGDCFQCGHKTSVEAKVRDDKSIYNPKSGEWITTQRDYSGLLYEGVTVLGLLVAVWLGFYTLLSGMEAPARLVAFNDGIYSVAGAGKVKGMCMAVPAGSDRPVEIPARCRKAI